jgi:hypothetical protein
MDTSRPPTEQAGPTADKPEGAHYNVHIHGTSYGLTIGEGNQVSQQFDGAAPPVEQPDSPAYAPARRRYLEALRERYGLVQTHAYAALAQDERVGQARQLPLLGSEGVYIPLRFDAPAARQAGRLEAQLSAGAPNKTTAQLRRQAERDLSPLTLAEALALPNHLAIIGDAGSGKTTLLHVLVTALAAEPGALALPDDLQAALPDPRPLPVLLPLRLFEHACGQNRYRRAAADLLRFVDDWFSSWCANAHLPPVFLAGISRPAGPGSCSTPWTKYPTPTIARPCAISFKTWPATFPRPALSSPPAWPAIAARSWTTASAWSMCATWTRASGPNWCEPSIAAWPSPTLKIGPAI